MFMKKKKLENEEINIINERSKFKENFTNNIFSLTTKIAVVIIILLMKIYLLLSPRLFT